MTRAFIVTALLLVGCSRSVVSDDPDAGALLPDGGVNCDDFNVELEAAENLAIACTPGDAGCTVTVQGTCCPIAVNDPDSNETKAYLAKLATYKASCHYACPAIACTPARGVCNATSKTCEQH